MEYQDEKMIKAMNQGKAVLNGDIYTGINMKGVLLKFREEVLFEERMRVMLPVNFSDMDEKIAKLKYLMEQRPHVIKTNEQASIDFTFNLLDVELISKQVSSLIDVFYNTIKSVHPSNIFYEKKTEVLEQFSVGWFDFKSHGVDAKIYCEAVLFQGKPLLVYSVKSELRDSEMIHTYLLKRKEGFSAPKQYNYNIIGASVDGQILAVKNDTVRVQMVIDQLQNTATAKWFAYSTVYSSPDGTGWYCMPEEGDRVRIYFPNEKEEEAYAISSINMSGGGSGGSRSNPDNKSISTKYGKTVELTPTMIVLTNNKGMSITMDDNEGITIVSDQDVTIQSKENLSLSSTSDAVNIEASESIELIQGGTKITLKDDVIVEGAKFKLQ